METVLAAVIGAGGAAIIAGLLQYIYVQRVKSGAIKTTEAEQLWKEAGAIRQEQAAEIVACRKENQELREETEIKMQACKEENLKLREDVFGLREVIIAETKEKQVLLLRLEKTDWYMAEMGAEIEALKGGKK